MRVVDELLAFLRSRLRIRLLVMILGIKIFEMRIFTSETNDEVVMRSGSRRKERTDQVLEQSRTPEPDLADDADWVLDGLTALNGVSP